MMDFNITEEELNALKIYREKDYEAMNQMLVSNSENDIALLSAEVENKVVSIGYNRESVIEYLKNIKLIYRLILKYYYSKKNKLSRKIYRGTNLSEIERVQSEHYIDRFLSTTENENDAINVYSANWNRPACMNLILDEKIPYIHVKDILKDKKYKNEILVSPFTKVKYIKELDEKRLEKNSKLLKVYEIELEKQELDALTEKERNGLYTYILENSYSIKRKLEECIDLEKDNVTNFENIRKLEQLLRKYEAEVEEKENLDDYSEYEREEDLDNIERITKELNELKDTSTNLFEIRKENINFVNIWKRNIAVYMIAECREIEKAFEVVYSSGNINDIINNNVEEIIEEAKNEIKQEETVIEDNFDSNIEEIDEIKGIETKEDETKFETRVLNREEFRKEELSLKEETEKVLQEVSNTIPKVDLDSRKTQISQDTIKINVHEKENDEIEVKNESKEMSETQIKIEDDKKEDIENTEKESTEQEIVTKEKSDKNSNKKNDTAKKGKNKSTEENEEDLEKTKIIKLEEDNSGIKEDEAAEEDEFVSNVKEECDENIENVEKLLENIKTLITKQQNHAKIAGNIGSTYSALNNAFEMRKASENLLGLVKNIKQKVNAISGLDDLEERNEKLEKISKTNIEISTLMNYLNNPKIAARNSRATRFDEMAIIEENELKRGIAEKIREIRGEAELKKLRDDYEIIEDKSAFSRFLGIFTGQNRLDDFMIEQIEVRQTAIRRTLSKKLSLAYNYSIHELMAEIQMFVLENEDDELVENDVIDLKAISDELRRNFVVLETKVQSVVFEKEGRNLPLDSRRISKMEIIEIETYRFLKKYGYDRPRIARDEPKYQDTMASEITRIVEYINSAGII